MIRNKFSTDKYTGCIYFTEHSVLVGTNKVRLYVHIDNRHLYVFSYSLLSSVLDPDPLQETLIRIRVVKKKFMSFISFTEKN